MNQPPAKRAWKPTPKQREFLELKAQYGGSEEDVKIAAQVGVKKARLAKWMLHPEFLRWHNDEVMKLITAEIPMKTAAGVRNWLDAVTGPGRVPTSDEARILLQLADRFNISFHVPEAVQHVHKTVMLVNMGSGPQEANLIDDRQMLPPIDGDYVIKEETE